MAYKPGNVYRDIHCAMCGDLMKKYMPNGGRVEFLPQCSACRRTSLCSMAEAGGKGHYNLEFYDLAGNDLLEFDLWETIVRGLDRSPQHAPPKNGERDATWK